MLYCISNMRIRNTIGWFFVASLLLFSSLTQWKLTEVPAGHYNDTEREEIYHLESPDIAGACYAISLPVLTVPDPVYYFLTFTFTYHPDPYQKRLFFFRKHSFISTFLRNVFYVFVSIHAP